MTTKKRFIGIILISFIAMLLSSNVAFPACPKPEYAPYELRAHIRMIVFNFLSDKALSPHTSDEILDLLDFYRSVRGNLLVSNCDVTGARTGMLISEILAKSITFVVECNDGFDNDRDGKIDLDDPGCADSSDNDETDCVGCPSPPLLLIRNAGTNIASFDKNGFLVIKGTLQQNTAPVQSSDDEFVVKDSSGNPVAMINLVAGNMIIKGSLFQNQGLLTPASSNNLIVKDNDDRIKAYIDNLGNLYLRESVVENGNP